MPEEAVELVLDYLFYMQEVTNAYSAQLTWMLALVLGLTFLYIWRTLDIHEAAQTHAHMVNSRPVFSPVSQSSITNSLASWNQSYKNRYAYKDKGQGEERANAISFDVLHSYNSKSHRNHAHPKAAWKRQDYEQREVHPRESKPRENKSRETRLKETKTREPRLRPEEERSWDNHFPKPKVGPWNGTKPTHHIKTLRPNRRDDTKPPQPCFPSPDQLPVRISTSSRSRRAPHRPTQYSSQEYQTELIHRKERDQTERERRRQPYIYADKRDVKHVQQTQLQRVHEQLRQKTRLIASISSEEMNVEGGHAIKAPIPPPRQYRANPEPKPRRKTIRTPSSSPTRTVDDQTVQERIQHILNKQAQSTKETETLQEFPDNKERDETDNLATEDVEKASDTQEINVVLPQVSEEFTQQKKIEVDDWVRASAEVCHDEAKETEECSPKPVPSPRRHKSPTHKEGATKEAKKADPTPETDVALVEQLRRDLISQDDILSRYKTASTFLEKFAQAYIAVPSCVQQNNLKTKESKRSKSKEKPVKSSSNTSLNNKKTKSVCSKSRDSSVHKVNSEEDYDSEVLRAVKAEEESIRNARKNKDDPSCDVVVSKRKSASPEAITRETGKRLAKLRKRLQESLEQIQKQPVIDKEELSKAREKQAKKQKEELERIINSSEDNLELNAEVLGRSVEKEESDPYQNTEPHQSTSNTSPQYKLEEKYINWAKEKFFQNPLIKNSSISQAERDLLEFSFIDSSKKDFKLKTKFPTETCVEKTELCKNIKSEDKSFEELLEKHKKQREMKRRKKSPIAIPRLTALYNDIAQNNPSDDMQFQNKLNSITCDEEESCKNYDKALKHKRKEERLTPFDLESSHFPHQDSSDVELAFDKAEQKIIQSEAYVLSEMTNPDLSPTSRLHRTSLRHLKYEEPEAVQVRKETTSVHQESSRRKVRWRRQSERSEKTKTDSDPISVLPHAAPKVIRLADVLEEEKKKNINHEERDFQDDLLLNLETTEGQNNVDIMKSCENQITMTKFISSPPKLVRGSFIRDIKDTKATWAGGGESILNKAPRNNVEIVRERSISPSKAATIFDPKIQEEKEKEKCEADRAARTCQREGMSATQFKANISLFEKGCLENPIRHFFPESKVKANVKKFEEVTKHPQQPPKVQSPLPKRLVSDNSISSKPSDQSSEDLNLPYSGENTITPVAEPIST